MSPIYSTPIFNLNTPKIQFRSNPAVYPGAVEPRKDFFSTNPLYDNFSDKNSITQIAKSNPRIMEILKENKIPLRVNIKELENLKQGHLKDTRVTAAKMYSTLPKEMKEEINLADLQQAAMFHDYGKVLIPETVLNKAGMLDEDERKIMQLHSELGYELLKNKGLSQNALNLIKYHHQTPTGSGYPSVDNNFEYSIPSQILATADKYSALREPRPYKDAMSREQALGIVKEDLENGLIAPEVYEALERAV